MDDPTGRGVAAAAPRPSRPGPRRVVEASVGADGRQSRPTARRRFATPGEGYRPDVATLLDYTHTEFPNHTLEVWHPDGWTMPVSDTSRDPRTAGSGHTSGEGVVDPGRSAPVPPASSPIDADPVSLPLVDHTVIAHVVGADATISLLERMRAAGWTRTAAVLVCPADPSVVPSGDEDRQSVTDLPDRRWLLTAAVGAVIGAVGAGLAAGLLADAVSAAVVAGGFGAILGAVVGAMLGGLGRHAGERAWSQPHAPGRTMGVVATFAEDERQAYDAVREMERGEPHDLRLVSASGAWRSPGGGPVPG